MCACVCACVREYVHVCVCVRERERERERIAVDISRNMVREEYFTSVCSRQTIWLCNQYLGEHSINK